MWLLSFIFTLMAISVSLLLITQVFLPFIKGTPYFPFFRKPTPIKEEVKKTAREVEELTEVVELRESLEELNRRKAELEKK